MFFFLLELINKEEEYLHNNVLILFSFVFQIYPQISSACGMASITTVAV